MAALTLALSLMPTAYARIITVDDDAPANFTNIQAAINVAIERDIVEVRPGTYTGPGNYNIRFNGKAITVRGTNPQDFDVVAATIIDCNSQGPGFIFDKKEYQHSVLSGLTITNGRSFGYYGGAIECREARPTISNCILVGNTAAKYGGGISSNSIDSPGADLIVKNCLITDNYAGGLGGGVYAGHLNSVTIDRCTITGNTSAWRGGALYGSSSVHRINKCIITGNKSGLMGGGITTRIGEMIITGCTITGNVAASTGGGFSAIGEAEPTVANSIIAGNSAPPGPEIAFHELDSQSKPRMSLSWCAIQGGRDQIHFDPNCTLDWGPGNIDADPCFANPGYWGHIADPNIRIEPNDPNSTWVNGDYHLKSQGGRWNPDEGGWTIDEVTSLCIDSGDPNSPLGLELFPNGGRINMGVYGGTGEASKSYFGKPLCETIAAGDINGDCLIDARDFALLAGNWLISGPLATMQATNPYPPDGQTYATGSVLTWTPGYGATSHDVYFGTGSSFSFQGNQTDTAFYPSPLPLLPDTTYYWQIDEVSAAGTIEGPVWTFTTGRTTTR
jgi:hypothetical protein